MLLFPLYCVENPKKKIIFDDNLKSPALGIWLKANLNREALALLVLRKKNVIRAFPLDFQSIKLNVLKPPQSTLHNLGGHIKSHGNIQLVARNNCSLTLSLDAHINS